MHAGTMLIVAAMLQGNPASPQAVADTVPAYLTDSAHSFDTGVVLRSSLLGQFPLDDPREGLTLVAGMVRRGTALGIGAGTGLRLRGGAPDGAAVYIDGAPIRNLLTEFANLHIEAQTNGTLLSGNAVDLRPDCGTWTGTTAGPVDCAALRLVERRYGNGDGVYDVSEQTAAFNAYYEAFFGSAQFYAPGRSARIGLEIDF
jgi:hypothetical protein